MKKTLIALSIAGVIGAAQAENTTTLYGALGYEVILIKAPGLDGNRSTKKTWDVDSSSLRLGVKGTEDLGEDLQAFYKLEFDFRPDIAKRGFNQTRYAYLGLKGGFGTITLGKQESLYKKVTGYNDIFTESSAFAGDMVGYNISYNSLYFGTAIAKAISYVSPNFSGLQFGIAGVLDGSNQVGFGDTSEIKSSRKSFTAWQTGIWYEQAGFFAGLGYASINGGTKNNNHVGKTTLVGGSVGYSNDTFRVGLGAEHASTKGQEYIPGQVYSLAGEYYFGPNTLRAGFAVLDRKGMKKVYTYALGYQYNFSKRTYAYTEGTLSHASDYKAMKNAYYVRVGIHHDF